MKKFQDSIANLDELALLCRDDRARAYIAEAVNCYRAGAYRSAIVAAWIAVCYDVIDKLRELTLAGDKEAEKLVEAMDKARAANDISRALKFERELLDLARDKFELISHIEHTDLNRLQEDRNRCAHPSLASDDEAFNPSGELARLHIRSAVTHLLQHPPVQGKYALDRLMKEVTSDYFPTDTEKAVVSLTSGPLRNPRESLTRNFIVLLVKNILADETDWKARHRFVTALRSVEIIHPDAFRTAIEEKLTTIIRPVSDERLRIVSWFFTRFPQVWDAIEVDLQHRIDNFVSDLPAEHISDLDGLIRTPFFETSAVRRLRRATRSELAKAFWVDMPEQISDRYVELYVESENFDQANSWAREVVIHASDFSRGQQETLIRGAAQNGQVLSSFEFGSVVAALRQTDVIPSVEYEALLGECNLEKYQAEA
jgi:hypothetical protein